MSEIKTGRRPGEPRSVRRAAGAWQQNRPGVYRCMVYLIPGENGRFSLTAATLPGVASQGDSEPEALANIVEALGGLLAVYQEQGRPIPWLKTPQEPEPGAKTRWVIAHA